MMSKVFFFALAIAGINLAAHWPQRFGVYATQACCSPSQGSCYWDYDAPFCSGGGNVIDRSGQCCGGGTTMVDHLETAMLKKSRVAADAVVEKDGADGMMVGKDLLGAPLLLGDLNILADDDKKGQSQGDGQKVVKKDLLGAPLLLGDLNVLADDDKKGKGKDSSQAVKKDLLGAGLLKGDLNILSDDDQKGEGQGSATVKKDYVGGLVIKKDEEGSTNVVG